MVITGKVTVDSWATLTIPEGITVTVCDGATLSVKGNIDIKGKIVVEHGGKLYRKEYGIYQKIVGPKDDEETAFTPLIRYNFISKHLVRTKLALEMEYSISWFGPLFI